MRSSARRRRSRCGAIPDSSPDPSATAVHTSSSTTPCAAASRRNVTASTTVSASSSPRGRADSATVLSTPVNVSACTIATMSAGALVSTRSTSAGAPAPPHSTSTLVTTAPYARTSAPGDRRSHPHHHGARVPSGLVRFATTASIPDVRCRRSRGSAHLDHRLERPLEALPDMVEDQRPSRNRGSAERCGEPSASSRARHRTRTGAKADAFIIIGSASLPKREAGRTAWSRPGDGHRWSASQHSPTLVASPQWMVSLHCERHAASLRRGASIEFDPGLSIAQERLRGTTFLHRANLAQCTVAAAVRGGRARFEPARSDHFECRR